MKFGARYGVTGLCGQTYGICTKDEMLRALPLKEIELEVDEFLFEAETRPQLTFLMTRIGCGLAGYSDHQIKPMFKSATSNVILPPEWQY